MSLIRFGGRKFAGEDSDGFRAFPSSMGDVVIGTNHVKKDRFVEVMFRVLERANVDFSDEDVGKVKDALYMDDSKEINHCDECGRRIEGNITDTCFSCYLELNEDGEE